MTSYTFGQDLYEDMLAAIDGARHQVLLESYIWKGDEIGERFKQALHDAAARGVEVYAIYDGFANLVVSPRFKRFRPPVRVLRYPVYTAGLALLRPAPLRPRPPQDPRRRRRGRLRRRLQHRLGLRHRVARHPRPDHRPGRLGPQARASPTSGTSTAAAGTAVRCCSRPPSDWEPRIRVHRNVPRLWMFPIRSMYLEAINRATRNIWLTHAYFIPDPDFVDALMAAARRGVDVRILVPAKSNHVVADWLSRGYYGELLDAGVGSSGSRARWCTPRPRPSTAPGSTVGTANIDRLSMTGNYEVNVEFIDPAMAAQMERIFAHDLENCAELTAEDWSARRLHKKFTELCPRAAAPAALTGLLVHSRP